MAKRWLTQRSITLESEQVNIVVHDPSQFTVNGLPVVGTGIALAPIGAVPNANAASLTGGSTLNLQPASAAFGGVVTTGAQTFAGVKNFQDGLNLGGNPVVSSLAAIGAVPNANAGSIVGSALNLQPASAAFGGVVTTGAQTFAGVKNFQDGIQVGGSTFAFQTAAPQACTPTLNSGTITTFTGSATYTNSLVGTQKSVYIGPFLVTANTGTPANLFYNAGNLMAAAYRPFTDLWFPVVLTTGSVGVDGICTIGLDGSIHFTKNDNSTLTATFGLSLGISLSWNA
jgi:hypothetical protein